MSDLLTKARDFLTGGDGWHGRLATAYAAVDAAETARAMHTTLEGILQAVDSMESLLHDIRGPISVPVREAQGAPAPHDGAGYPGEGSRERGGSLVEPPAAPATPQVGEVWEDTKDGEMVEVLEGPPYDGAYPCRRIGSPWTDPIYRPVLNGDWRRVSPAPAPLTEREVTAEAQAQGVTLGRGWRIMADECAKYAEAQGVEPEVVTFPLVAESLDEGADEDRRREREMFFGVEPASDTDIAHDSVAVLALQRHHSERYYRLIARVRAEQARADEAFGRAEKAEAQVALMRPVVEAAQEYEDTHPRDEREARGCALICPAVRAYREATRGE